MVIGEKLRAETARDYALRTIARNIISLDLAPGSMVSENELSAEMGLSRTPIREALIELSKSQIVEILPQKGSRISLIDYDYVEESRFLRLVLESAVIELACGLAGDMDFSRLDEILKLQELCLLNTIPSRLLELDDEFHRELFHLSNKAQTYRLMNSMTIHFDRVRSMSLTVIEDLGTSDEHKNIPGQIVDDHKNIVAAIQKANHAEAKALVSAHLSRYKIDEAAIRRKYPQCFKLPR